MRPWRSLRVRLVISYMALALLLLTISGFVFSAVLSAYAELVQRQRAAGYVLQIQTVMADARANRSGTEETLRRLQEHLPELHVEQLTPAREREEQGLGAPPLGFGERDRLLLSAFVTPRPLEPLMWSLPYITSRGPRVIYKFTLPPDPGAVLRSLRTQLLGVLALAFGLAALVGLWLSRWLSRPLARLTGATGAVAAGDFVQTVAATGVTELDELVGQFNSMVLSLQESFRSLGAERDVARRFAADAAHELRTPVAALRAYHDVVSENSERLEQALPAIRRQVERMERVIDGLLQVAALGEGTGITLVPRELWAVVRPLVPFYQSMGEDYGHNLQVVEPTEPLPVRVDARLVELAVTNLVDNACKYTPAGGEIQISLGRDGGEAVIAVVDTGPGIAAEELAFIFERFHRGVATQTIPGSGLGLAIVQEAVRRLGGTVSVASEPGKGSRFECRFALETG